MKTILILATLFIGLVFQSCSPQTDIKPITPDNVITVKVINLSEIMEGQYKQLSIKSGETSLLNTTITGNYEYSFKSRSDIFLTVCITSPLSFNSAIEIDLNGQIKYYHAGSCPGTEYSMAEQISF